MKKNIFKLLFLIFTILGVACSSDTTDDIKTIEENNTDNNAVFKITIEGVDYTSNSVQAGTEDGIILFSTRINNTVDLIQISFSENIKIGTYDLKNNDVNILYIKEGASTVSNTFKSISGSFNLSKHDNKAISASFDVVLTDILSGTEKVTMTGGEVNDVSYVQP